MFKITIVLNDILVDFKDFIAYYESEVNINSVVDEIDKYFLQIWLQVETLSITLLIIIRD